MNKQQQTALNMARFIKSQSLTLLEKLDALDADKVQITVGGKDRLDTFGKKMELYHFYERNDKLVVKEKE